MSASSRNQFGYAAAVLLLAAGLGALGWILSGAWSAFAACPNRDVLSWDANLRYLTVLDMRRDLAAGDLTAGLRPIFDSPTWPALRPVLALLVFAVAPGGPSTVLDVGLTYALFVALWLALAVLAWRLAGSPGVAVWLGAAVALLSMRELWLYALSAMLEIQGMLFAVGTAYFCYVLFADAAGNEDTAAPGGRVSRATLAGLFVGIQGLYHTKYPYGVILLVALVLLEIARLPYGDADFRRLPLRILLRGGDEGRGRIGAGGTARIVLYFVFVCCAALALGGGRRLGLELSDRGLRNLFYAATLLVFVDFNVALFRGRVLLRETLAVRTRALYATAILPAAVWMLVHPDRFSATLGTRDHVQDASRSFLQALGGEVWFEPAVFVLPALAAAVFVLAVFVAGRRVRPPAPVRALAFLLVLWALQIAVLELTTPNKQLRHVYHLLPAALVLCLAAGARLALLAAASIRTGALRFVADGDTKFPVGAAAGVLLPLLLALPGLPRATALVSGAQFDAEAVCFTGDNPGMVAPARRLARAFAQQADRKTVAVNLLHKLTQADGSWPAGRYIATDIDLLLREAARARGGELRSDDPPLATWAGFSQLLLIADRCDESYEEAIAARAAGFGLELRAAGETRQDERGICLRRYDLIAVAE